MKVFRGLDKFPVSARGTVVAIGNFDGLHLGHRKILRRVTSLARAKKLSALVLTFDPHPARSFKGRSVPLIQTMDQRLEGLSATGIDKVLVLRFGRAFAGLSGRAFAERILVRCLKARDVVVGENFRFGFERRCGVEDLARLGRELGFGVHAVAPVIFDGQPVSSSRIRGLLAHGDVDKAAGPLGGFYAISGLVVPGEGRGSKLGIPTANLRTANEILPSGVFLTKAEVRRGLVPSLTNIGTAPTFQRGRILPETHILGGRGPLYGLRIRLLFVKKLRNERRFSSTAALVLRIGRDIEAARKFFRRTGA
jgi:riboflavin kinase / FMN adenylyltransferase